MVTEAPGDVRPGKRGAPSDLAFRSFIGSPLGCLYYSRKTGFRFPSTALLRWASGPVRLNPRDSILLMPRSREL